MTLITDLPLEILYIILNHLNVKEILIISKLCKIFRNILLTQPFNKDLRIVNRSYIFYTKYNFAGFIYNNSNTFNSKLMEMNVLDYRKYKRLNINNQLYDYISNNLISLDNCKKLNININKCHTNDYVLNINKYKNCEDINIKINSMNNYVNFHINVFNIENCRKIKISCNNLSSFIKHININSNKKLEKINLENILYSPNNSFMFNFPYCDKIIIKNSVSIIYLISNTIKNAKYVELHNIHNNINMNNIIEECKTLKLVSSIIQLDRYMKSINVLKLKSTNLNYENKDLKYLTNINKINLKSIYYDVDNIIHYISNIKIGKDVLIRDYEYSFRNCKILNIVGNDYFKYDSLNFSILEKVTFKYKGDNINTIIRFISNKTINMCKHIVIKLKNDILTPFIMNNLQKDTNIKIIHYNFYNKRLYEYIKSKNINIRQCYVSYSH